MDKMRQLAMIVLVGLGIYMIWMLGFNLVASITMLFLGYEIAFSNLTALILNAACLAVAVYFLILKRRVIAQKITGNEQPAQHDVQVDWLPFAFRLTAVAAGLFIVPRIIFRITQIIRSYALQQFAGAAPDIEELLMLAMLTALAAYLICGAPHFVKWQVNKTLQQCPTEPAHD